MFREQLRTLFGLRLTRAEVAGLVSAFRLHRDDMVDAKEFSFRYVRHAHCFGKEVSFRCVSHGRCFESEARN